MTTQSISTPWWRSAALATKVLNGSAKFWFATVLVGQAIFSFYIVMFYYTATVSKDIERFNQVMPAGYIEGDFWGNLAVIAHVLFAAIITVSGLIQLIPLLRNKYRSFHRWNGRLYIMTAMIMSLSGVFMVISRSDQVTGDMIGHVAILINGGIIMLCAVMAFKYARAREITRHRIWALRLFIAVSGVWMFRVGLMAWLTVHGKPVGFDPVSFSGPFLNVLYFLVYVMPLLFLEAYLRSQSSASAPIKLLTAGSVLLLSMVVMGGVFGATMGLWLPRI